MIVETARRLLLQGMQARAILVIAALAALGPDAMGRGAFTAIHPEEALPDSQTRPQSGPYSELISRVQEKLHGLGFDAGPVNGDFGEKTQAALAQFQLSRTLPASGQLDDDTLSALGIERPRKRGAS